jgi:DNA-binding NarL/FixJ family response regulator
MAGADAPVGRGGAVTRVLVVDDHTTFSELLALALSGEPDLECVGTARTADEGIARTMQLRPDLVVMDVQLGEDDGVEATALLTEKLPELRVVVLTAHADSHLMQRAADAGACCLLAKDGSLPDLLDALRRSHRGGLVVDPSLLRTLMSTPAGRPEPSVRVPRLTRRESDVLRMLADGLDTGTIGRELGISVHTCRGYVKGLLQKLNAHSQLEAVAIATRYGLIDDRADR